MHILQKADARPRSRAAILDQRSAILDAAAVLFLEFGFAGVSIDAINRVVGGSKRDLYKLFADKTDLFSQAVGALSIERAQRMQASMPKCETIEASLFAAGRAFLRLLIEPKTIALHRLLVTEGARVPEAATRFLLEGPSHAYSALADVLTLHAAEVQMDIPDPNGASRLFLDAVSGALQLRALLGQSVGEGEIDTVVAAAVKVFLDGWRPRLNDPSDA